MPPCGRKKGLLMVESSGCAAFGHPAAVLGSLPDSIGRKPWRQKLSRASRILARRRRAIEADALVEHHRLRAIGFARCFACGSLAKITCQVPRGLSGGGVLAAQTSRLRPMYSQGRPSAGDITAACAAAPSRANKHASTARRRLPSQSNCTAWRCDRTRLHVPGGR